MVALHPKIQLHLEDLVLQKEIKTQQSSSFWQKFYFQKKFNFGLSRTARKFPLHLERSLLRRNSMKMPPITGSKILGEKEILRRELSLAPSHTLGVELSPYYRDQRSLDQDWS